MYSCLLEYLGMCSLASHVLLFELSNGFTKTYEWSQEDADSVPIFAMTAMHLGMVLNVQKGGDE